MKQMQQQEKVRHVQSLPVPGPSPFFMPTLIQLITWALNFLTSRSRPPQSMHNTREIKRKQHLLLRLY
jgi:hypothetical protein